jgi:hypothetical protein
MQTNNHKIVDYDAVLDAKFGKKGTASRAEAEDKAFAFYTGQIIEPHILHFNNNEEGFKYLEELMK